MGPLRPLLCERSTFYEQYPLRGRVSAPIPAAPASAGAEDLHEQAAAAIAAGQAHDEEDAPPPEALDGVTALADATTDAFHMAGLAPPRGTKSGVERIQEK